MSRVPGWIPELVNAHAQRLLASGGLGAEATAQLIRLVRDPEMRKVWQTLSRASPDQTALTDFLDQVRLHQAVLGPLLPPTALTYAQERTSLKRVGKLATALLAELRYLGGSGETPLAGLLVLENTLRRAESEMLSELQASGPIAMLGLRSLSLEDEDVVSPIEALHWLAEAAERAAEGPRPSGPRKQQARNALRTAYIQDLSVFVRNRFGKPFHSAVATTVSVSLQDPNVNEDLVRKLSAPKRKIPRRASR